MEKRSKVSLALRGTVTTPTVPLVSSMSTFTSTNTDTERRRHSISSRRNDNVTILFCQTPKLPQLRKIKYVHTYMHYTHETFFIELHTIQKQGKMVSITKCTLDLSNRHPPR